MENNSMKSDYLRASSNHISLYKFIASDIVYTVGVRFNIVSMHPMISVKRGTIKRAIKSNHDYYEANKEYRKEYGRRYYEANKKDRLEYGCGYYKNNKKDRLEYGKDYYKNNKEDRLEYSKDYYNNHSEEYSEYRAGYKAEKKYGKFIALNEWFEGCNLHHITSHIIIHIPKNLHISIPHNSITKRGMKEINFESIEYLLGEYPY